MYYDNAAIYIEETADLLIRIQRITAVIAALETNMLTSAATGSISEYSLDDGQTKIRTVYRDTIQVAAAITGFERIKQRYINQLNGRTFRLVDGKNFTG